MIPFGEVSGWVGGSFSLTFFFLQMYYNFRSWIDIFGQEMNLNLNLYFLVPCFTWNSWLLLWEACLAPAPGAVNLPGRGMGRWGGRCWLHLEQRKDQQATELSSQQNSDYPSELLKNTTFRSLEDFLHVHEFSLKSCDLVMSIWTEEIV